MTTIQVPDRADVLVIGGGIAGISASVEAAEAGCDVVLIEKNAHLGGRVARMHLYFPKLCPPGCGLEINFRRLKQSRRIRVFTGTRLESIGGSAGAYTVVLTTSPRFVTDACTSCGECLAVCPADRPDDVNYGLSKTKAIFHGGPQSYPARYAIDRAACPADCDACARACKYGAIDLGQQPRTQTLQVASVIAATGWKPYDATRIDNLGFGRAANVITNVMLERLAAVDGPTTGRILRPSDGKPPASVAFVQCAGSRDENHLPYCSAVCCSASLKHATYVRTSCPDAAVTVFYIDLRTPGRLEDFLTKVSADPRVRLVKGKVASAEEDPETGDVVVEVEDVFQGRKSRERFGLVVLATGLVPQSEDLPEAFPRDEFGFLLNPSNGGALYAAGCARHPEEVSASVQDATGAALRALQTAVRSARHG
jgi:quinone-modifying oxidoreductase subunit QmoA